MRSNILGGVFWGIALQLALALGPARVAYAAPVDFGALDGTFSSLAGDLIPSIGSLIGSLGGFVLIPLALAGVAAIFGLIWRFVR